MKMNDNYIETEGDENKIMGQIKSALGVSEMSKESPQLTAWRAWAKSWMDGIDRTSKSAAQAKRLAEKIDYESSSTPAMWAAKAMVSAASSAASGQPSDYTDSLAGKALETREQP